MKPLGVNLHNPRKFNNQVGAFMRLVIIFFLVTMTNLHAELIRPVSGSTLNYTHVLFEWDQIPDAQTYRIQIASDNEFNDIVNDANASALIIIVTENLAWETTYYWRIAPVNQDNQQGSWLPAAQFSIGSTRSSAEADLYIPTDYSAGLTIFGSFFDYFSAAIDANGLEVWNSGNTNTIYYSANTYGQLFGSQYDNSLAHNIPAFEFDLDIETIWAEPNEEYIHHELIQLPNGNYLGIATVTEFGPIPIGSWSSLYQAIGYIADGVTAEYPWLGDRIVEWDQDTGEEVWSWNVFDHFSLQDYDALGGTWEQSYFEGSYDWTHVNALWFDEAENALYISVRHLSRITKIDYPSGDILWNMGLELYAGEVDCGHDLGFSFQHGLELTDNGSIVTFDNGNLSTILLGTEEPLSRGMEIQVDDMGRTCAATVAWEHSLPADLFGLASGNTQKLSNGNYLITTIGGGGTTLEITPDHQVVWEGNYNLSLPNGAVYRGHRIPGLHPIGLSIQVPGLTVAEDQPTVMISTGESTAEFLISNEGSRDEEFQVQILEDGNWFDDYITSIVIPAEGEALIAAPGSVTADDNPHFISITVTPHHHPHLSKTIAFPFQAVAACPDGYLEITDYPATLTILGDAGDCFAEQDFNALQDLITANDIDLTSGLYLGRQTWTEGRLRVLIAGNYYLGGNVSMTTLPDSFGDLDDLRSLYLDWNLLTTLPDSFGQLINLVNLHLANNQLTGLFPDLGNLQQLEILDLGYNEIEAIPESIGLLENMVYFWIFNNQLNTLPESVCNLDLNWDGVDNSFLPYFACGGNQLCALIPDCVAESTYFESGLDQFYYLFIIDSPQDCLDDVNQDGAWDILDVVITVLFILDQEPLTPPQQVVADLNEDGSVDILDLVLMVEMILEG